MESEDSRDAAGDDPSSSSESSSGGSRRRSRSSSSDRGNNRPRPPSPPRSSPSPSNRLSAHDNMSDARSDINSPEHSLPASPDSHNQESVPPKSPRNYENELCGLKSPKTGPQTPQSPVRSTPVSPSPEVDSTPASPDSHSGPLSPMSPKTHVESGPTSPDHKSPQDRKARSHIAQDWGGKKDWSHRKSDISRSRSGSDSSRSSRDSSYNKRCTAKDPATEEISEGEMESDADNKSQGVPPSRENNSAKADLNFSHEDLSDVSDLDSMAGDEETEKPKEPKSPSPVKHSDPKVNGNEVKTRSPIVENGTLNAEPKKQDKQMTPEKTHKPEDGEELDFEAEEGECVEAPPPDKDRPNSHKDDDAKSVGEASAASSLEEGEVSDEGERRPEESEPRPICRFYSRGQCTWGMSCRFLHPGVTDKGNYSMFEVVRGVPTHPPPAAFPPRPEPPPPESAWERGLRTAKEMLRQANKRKEQDMDFEEKKLHLSVGGAVHDPDAELAYAAAAVGASPPRAPDYPEHYPHHRPPHLYGRGGYGPPPHRRPFPPGRPMDDRELFERPVYDRPPYERLHYDDPKLRYEDHKPRFDEKVPPVEEGPHLKRRIRSSREVIVQRAPPPREPREGRAEAREGRLEGREGRDGRLEGREGRLEGRESRPEGREVREPPPVRPAPGDEWADPWMRESAAARRRRPPSSHSSYSTSSSRSSRSPGARRDKQRSSASRQRLSPSVIVRERRLATARATAMNPPAPRRRAPSPAAARQHAANPPAPVKDGMDAFGRTKPARSGHKRYSRSSTSGSESSSSTSGSESDSRSSSSSGSSDDARRARTVRALTAANRPRLGSKPAGLGTGTIAAAANKKDSLVEQKESGKKRTATSPVQDAPAKKSVSRREELLKQLKAVEDAIARKRSKI